MLPEYLPTNREVTVAPVIDQIPSTKESAVYPYGAFPWFQELLTHKKTLMTKEGKPVFESILVGTDRFSVLMTAPVTPDNFSIAGQIQWVNEGQKYVLPFQVFRPSRFDYKIITQVCDAVDNIFITVQNNEEQKIILDVLHGKLQWLTEVEKIASTHEPFVVFNGIGVNEKLQELSKKLHPENIQHYESGYNTSLFCSTLNARVSEYSIVG